MKVWHFVVAVCFSLNWLVVICVAIVITFTLFCLFCSQFGLSVSFGLIIV